LSDGTYIAAPPGRRLDQWLWFARLAKSRSLAARLCTAGEVALNGVRVRKPNHLVRVGDTLAAPQGGWRRSVRVLALGSRRGPPPEARLLYEETAPPLRLLPEAPGWEPLLADPDGEDTGAALLKAPPAPPR
jgi:ribosome-associated heat shock protein Hsp15